MSPAYVFAANDAADTPSTTVSQDVDDETVVIDEEEGAAAATPALANEGQDPDADQNHMYEMGKDVPIQSFTMEFTIDSVKYVLKATKDAEGNTVIEGMDALNAKYPEGIPFNTVKDMNVNMGLYFDPSSINEPKKGDTIEYDLDKVIKVSKAVTGKVYNDDGTVVIADYALDTNGHIKFTLGESSDGFKDGNIKFGAKLDTTKWTEGNPIPVIIGGMEIDIPVKPNVIVDKCDYTVGKAAWNPLKNNTGAYIGEAYNSTTKKFESYAMWRIRINAPNTNTKTVTGVVVTELIPSGYEKYIQKNTNGTPRIETVTSAGAAKTDPNFAYNTATGQYEWTVPDVAKNTNKDLYIKVWLDDTYTGQELKNKVSAVRPGENPKTASATLTPSNNLQLKKTVGTPYYNASGELCAEYTVYVSSKLNSMDLYDAVVTDSFGDDAQYIKRIETPRVYVRAQNGTDCDKTTAVGDGWQDIPYSNYNGKYNDKSNLPYVTASKGGAPLATYPDSLTVDNTKKEIKWTVDRIPAIGSETSNNLYSRPGSRLIKYVAVIDEAKAKDKEENGVQKYHAIKNTAEIKHGDKSAKSEATLSVEKKWLKKIGEAANDVGRKGAVKYTITLQ
ncbi:MAG: hypothetical protein KBS66_07710, partial [Eubacterium sp.]|nr:hypothetical protein [Candidatus Colimonas fimequi]